METIGKMFDTQKEWLGWIVGALAVWMGVKLFAMPTPDALHMKAFTYTLITAVALVSAKTIGDIVSAVKGIKGPS